MVLLCFRKFKIRRKNKSQQIKQQEQPPQKLQQKLHFDQATVGLVYPCELKQKQNFNQRFKINKNTQILTHGFKSNLYYLKFNKPSINQASSTSGGVVMENSNIEWMTSLPEPLRDLSIINLAIPGSHNSMTYGITSASEIAPDAEVAIKRLYRIFPWFVRRWARTQAVNVQEQLELGVRYFDLRVCQHNDKFFYTHALYAMEIFEPLHQIRQFLDAHTSEVVIIDFQHFYDMKISHHMQLHAQLLDLFAHRLFATTDGTLADCTLNYCQQLGRQVVLIYRRCALNLPREFWSSSAWPTPWPNVSSSKKLLQFLRSALLSRQTTQGYVSQCVLTPSGRYIAFRFLSSLRGTAKKVEKKVYPWLEQQKPGPFDVQQPPRVNVIIADYVELNKGQFCKWVIELNKTLLEELQQGTSSNEDNNNIIVEMYDNEREI